MIDQDRIEREREIKMRYDRESISNVPVPKVQPDSLWKDLNRAQVVYASRLVRAGTHTPEQAATCAISQYLADMD